jgi:signal transduction histidine kinase
LIPIRMQLQGFTLPDGFGTLGICHDLSAEKSAQVQAVQAERMRLLREIGAGLAHELNSPLSIIVGNTELLLEAFPDPALRERLEPAREAADRIVATVQNLQHFSRPVIPSEWTLVDVSVLAQQTVQRVWPLPQGAPEGTAAPVRLQLVMARVPLVRANPVELQEALRELVTNAVQALREGGTVTVSTREADGHVHLTVADDGVGMSEEVRQFCTEPFFTTRRPLATGLGLNRVYHTVVRHRGQLLIDSAEGKGTAVTIALSGAPAE